ncbi:hypothetical protein AAH446_10860 [Erwinia sp. P6884]|uniref:hypothetical protein n=1 Tax=Erwinia sp. P6884 TaxID=3141450 RepID=UPI00318EBAB0
MTLIIWKKSKPGGTSKSRYKARREEKLASVNQEKRLKKEIAVTLSGCSPRVWKALKE